MIYLDKILTWVTYEEDYRKIKYTDNHCYNKENSIPVNIGFTNGFFN